MASVVYQINLLGREENINLPKQHKHVDWLRYVHGGHMAVSMTTWQRGELHSVVIHDHRIASTAGLWLTWVFSKNEHPTHTEMPYFSNYSILKNNRWNKLSMTTGQFHLEPAVLKNTRGRKPGKKSMVPRNLGLFALLIEWTANEVSYVLMCVHTSVQ